MKKIALLVVAFALSASAQAATYTGAAGCGLGSYVFKEDNMLQIFAATTNGTFGNQTFAISTGTLNCKGNKGFSFNQEQQELYVASNFDSLTQEMAQGSGEHLSALATLLGCQNNYGEFSAAVKGSSSSESSDQMLQSARSAAADLKCQG